MCCLHVSRRQMCGILVPAAAAEEGGATTYIFPIWCLSIVIGMSHFVKVVFIQLPDEAGKVTVLKVFRKYALGEFFVLEPNKIRLDWGTIEGQRITKRTSRTTKLSPSLLHRTTELYAGSSSILSFDTLVSNRRWAGRSRGCGGLWRRRVLTCRVCAPVPFLVSIKFRSVEASQRGRAHGRMQLTKSLDVLLLPPA